VSEPKTLHARLHYLRRAARLDIASDAAERFFPRVPVTALHRRFADEFLGRAGVDGTHQLIGLNLGAAHAVKRWSPARFAQLADALLRSDSSTRIVIFGSRADRVLLEQFETELAACEAQNGVVASSTAAPSAQHFKNGSFGNNSFMKGLMNGKSNGARDDAQKNGAHDESLRGEGFRGDLSSLPVQPGGAWRGRVLVAVGRIDLMQLAAMGERCTAVVTADTGPMHIMAAVGAPLVALFGPTSVANTGPVQKPDGAPIRVLDGRAMSGLPRAPMDTIEVEHVLRELQPFLKQRGAIMMSSSNGAHN
jgi:ADP-heptose:LPS heptosyltransferase